MRTLLHRCCLLFSLLSLAAPAMAQNDTDIANLTILTDASLIPALTVVARNYSKQTHIPVGFTTIPAEVDEAISQGLEAHAIVTLNQQLIRSLTEHGLIDRYSIQPLAQTRLVLVTTRNSDVNGLLTQRISFAAVLGATPSAPVLFDPASTPAGAASAKLTSGFEFSESLAKRAVEMESRAALLARLRDEGGLAILPANDVRDEPDLVVLNPLPESVAPPLIYTRAILASESMDRTRGLMRYLESEAGKAFLRKQGLEVPD